jgi:3-oxoacyl-[acyl-carrier protein] reductase
MNRNKNILIIGGSGGIGSEILKKFVENNYNCYFTYSKNLIFLEKKFLKKNNKSIIPLKINFLDKKWKNKLKVKLKKIKIIDCLVNCVGINIIKKFDKISYNDFRKINSINYESYFFATQLSLKKLKQSNNPRIVNISSIWSVVSKSKRTLYSGAKGAINSFTRSLSLECSKNNILVNCVSPGFVETALTKASLSKKEINSLKKEIPLKRFANPKEIAELVYFFGSEKNSYTTGQNIICDGGFTVQ